MTPRHRWHLLVARTAVGLTVGFMASTALMIAATAAIDWAFGKGVGDGTAAGIVLGSVWVSVTLGCGLLCLLDEDREQRRGFRVARRLCVRCGYTLSGLPDETRTCPECEKRFRRV